MIKFDDFDILKKIYETIDLNDISIKVGNSSQEFIDKIINDFTLVIYKSDKKKSIHPKKINGNLQTDDFSIHKEKKRSSLSIIMNNGDIIIGTYNTSSFNVAISINDDIIYDIKIKDCDDNKFVDKMKDEYIKYLTNKKYKIKKYQENAKY